MLDRIYAEMRDLQVSWKGKSKNKKTGVESDLIQAVKTAPDGKLETYFLSCFKPVDALHVGDRIDAKLAIKAFNGALYLNLMEFVLCAGKTTKDIKV